MLFSSVKKGIVCSCDNKWIGEWRQFKRASKDFPCALKCSNHNGTLVEIQMVLISDCEDVFEIAVIFAIVGFIGIPIVSLTYYCCKTEIFVWRLIGKKKYLYRTSWKKDVYISLYDNNNDVRAFVLTELHELFHRKGVSTFTSCHDEDLGRPKEEYIKENITKCKNCLIIQSKGMYSSVNNHNSRRYKFTVAWNHFVKRKIETIFVIKFDDCPD